MAIAKITKAYTRYYADNRRRTTYVEWIDTQGHHGRTEGAANNSHMAALLARTAREDVEHTFETWG